MDSAVEGWERGHRLRLVLVAAGVAGILANYPLVFFQLQPGPGQVAVWLGTNLVLLVLVVLLGLWLAPRAGLGGSVTALSRAGLLTGVALGVVGIVWFAAVATLLGHLDFIRHELAVPAWVAVLGGAGAAITEEIGYRLGLMTLLAWVVLRLGGRARPAMWAAILASSALFGLGHVGTAGAAVAGTASGFATVVVTTGGTGVLFGWLYWRRGLVAAMVAHAVVDCAGTLVAPSLLAVMPRL